MKRKLLLAALLVAGALGMRAQSDVTSTYITNPSFESDGLLSAGNGTNPNIITPTGWTQEQNTAGSYQDNKICDAETSNGSNYGTLVTPSDGTYYLFYRHGWNGSNYAKFTSTAVNLPAGAYTLKVDYKMVSGSDNTNNNDNTAITLSAISGETTLGSTTATGAVQVNSNGTTAVLADNDWITLETTFTLETETSTQFVINLLACGPKRSDFVVDNVKLLYTAISRPTAVSISSSLALTVGGTSTLTPTYTPADANTDTDITWTTSDATVATVANGVVTAVGPGSATITATTANDKSSNCTVTVSDVAAAAAPSFYASAIESGTDYYLYNAAEGKFLGTLKEGWGTQAALTEHGIPFTLTVSDGVYTLDSHTYNNADDHYLNNGWVDGASANFKITSLGAGKFSISTEDGTLFMTANTSNTVVANAAPTANSVLAQWYIVSKENLENALASATSASPVDATFYIQDPDFSRNHWPAGRNTSSWSVTASNKNLKGGNNDNMCAETYQNGGGTIYQTLTVPNGRYGVKCQGFYRQDSGSTPSYLYANDEKQELNVFNANSEGTAANMGGASTSFSAGLYQVDELIVNVTDGSLTVGIEGQAGNWTCFDNFELNYYGPTIEGEAEELPNTAMTANKWYYFNVAMDGDYDLTTTTIGDIVYTTDGTILIENEGNVTDNFSGTSEVALTAGRYYVKSSSAQTLAVNPHTYSYEIGSATLSTGDGGYTQSSTFTVTFPDAVSTDPDAEEALVASSKATVNGNEVALVATTNGFTLDLGSLTANTDYVIAIPANVYGYAGESMNSAISVTIHTPVLFDGEYCLYDAANEVFLARGGSWGTEAVGDKYGVPFNLVTDASGVSSIEFVDLSGVYLFKTNDNGMYTDNASTGWNIIAVGGGYKIKDSGSDYYAKVDNASLGYYVHAVEGVANATVWTLKTKSERDEIIAAYPAENKNNVITASGISTNAGDFETFLSTNYNEVDCTSVIGTATFAGSVGDWTWSVVRGQDGQPAYGENFAEVWTATGTFTQTVGKANLPAGIYKVTVQGYERRKDNSASTSLYEAGYNLVSTYLSANGEQVRFTDWNEVDGKPTNTGGAVTAFTAGEAVNEVYVYLDGNTDLTLTVKKPNYIWDCWTIFNNFTLTRYEQAEATMAVTDAKWGTFYAPFEVAVPDGVKAYTVADATDGVLNLVEVDAIPAKTPVVLYSESVYSGTKYGKAETGDQVESLLTGTLERIPAPNGSYILQKQGDKVGFYQVNTSVATPYVPANRAYIAAEESFAKAFFFPGDDEATLIEGLDALTAGEYEGIYTLGGVKVDALQKGTNIVQLKSGKTLKINVK